MESLNRLNVLIQQKSNMMLVCKTVFRDISTTSCQYKKTPHTIGIKSWVRAAYRRKYIEQNMKDKIKSEEQILKEEQLKRTEPKIEFRTTSRKKEVKYYDENAMKGLQITPEVFFSRDKKTIICYHPPPKTYPQEYTKPAVGDPKFAIKKSLLETFKDRLTGEEIIEATNLREENPRLWNNNALAKLFKTDPDAIGLQVPLTESQYERAKAEKEIYENMSVMKKKRFRELQDWERLKYVRRNRDRNFVTWYRTIQTPKNSVKQRIPPRF